MNTQYIKGNVTERKLHLWLVRNRPHIAACMIGEVKGFYRLGTGFACSFQACGETWRDVAFQLNAIDRP